VPNICVEEDSEVVIPGDTVIFAVGQKPDLSEDFGVELGRGNRVAVQADGSCATSVPGVFAAGDVVTGTLSVISAIAGGRKAASEIDRYLGGDGVIDEELAPRAEGSPWIGRDEGYASRPRCGNDAEEAERCLQCDLRLDITPRRFWADYAAVKNRLGSGSDDAAGGERPGEG